MISSSRNSRDVVAVAMSGGVDSSVAAALLLESGYRVIGLTMRLWSEDGGGNSPCCSLDGQRDAAAVASQLGFPHYTVDLSREFFTLVVKDFISEYVRGRTPNPCIRCNTFMKWQLLWEKAQKFGADFFATGHYARIERDPLRIHLRRAAFRSKDQSYALWGISQEELKRTILPLGNMRKEEVREKAVAFGLPNARRTESQEICFIPKDNYRDFLSEHGAEILQGLGSGEIIGPGGKVLGHHAGFPNYTIGQRHGLGLTWPRPLYVKRIDAEVNRIFVDEAEGCYGRAMRVEQVNWVSWEKPLEPFEVEVQIRYRDPGKPARLLPNDDGSVEVEFLSPAWAITPGQSAVFYHGDLLIGGGIIASVRA
ncbi:MAG: tRNA 2-thiouridine(34) synthase MnmA [bacterium]